MMDGCDRESEIRVRYTRGEVFLGNQGDQICVDHSAEGGMRGSGWVGCSPSVALPRFSFLYIGAHGPHGSCAFSPAPPGPLFPRAHGPIYNR